MKSVKVILMTIVATLAVNTAAAQTMDEAVAKYEAGMAKLNAKSYAESIKLLTESMNMGIDLEADGAELVREIQGLLPKISMQEGMTAAQTKNYDVAIASFLKAEELADLYNDVQTRRQASRYISNVYMAVGAESFNAKDYTKALEAFSKGYEQDPQNVKLAIFTAKSYAELGELVKAADIYKGVIEAAAQNSKFAEDAKSATTDITTYVLVGISEAGKEQNLDKTIELADLLATAVPNEPLSNLAVIQLANNLKKYDIVIERGDKAAEAQTEPEKKSEAYFLQGVAYQNKENKAKAIESFRKVTAGPNVAAARTAVTELSK